MKDSALLTGLLPVQQKHFEEHYAKTTEDLETYCIEQKEKEFDFLYLLLQHPEKYKHCYDRLSEISYKNFKHWDSIQKAIIFKRLS